MACNMTYDKWIKLLKRPMDIHWSQSLTEEERAKVHGQLPRLAAYLEQEQKELIKIKKLSDQFEREVGAKDTQLSKERLKMRLRMKLADKKEAKAKEKAARKHTCSNREDCKRCEKKREKKFLAAQKILDDAKLKDPEFAEEQQCPEGENASLLQYREHNMDNDDHEKEKDGQNGEAEKIYDGEDDGNELGATACAAACALPQDYASSFDQDDQERKLKMQGVEYFGDKLFAEGRHFNPHIRMHQQKYAKVESEDDKAVRCLMHLLKMSEKSEPNNASDDFTKFFDYSYKF